MPAHQSVETLEVALSEFVSSYPFNNIAVLLEVLGSFPEDEKYDPEIPWAVDSGTLIEKYGGGNCVTSTSEFIKTMDKLHEWDCQVVATPSDRLPEGITVEDVPYQHMAIVATHRESGLRYLVDPGLGLVKVIPLSGETEPIMIADRLYQVKVDEGEGVDSLHVTKPDGTRLYFNFINCPPDFNPELEVQAPLIRATTAFKIDVINREGYKETSFKIDFFGRKILFMVRGDMDSYSFDEYADFFRHPQFGAFCREIGWTTEEMERRISMAINREDDVVSIWLEPLQREYYLAHSHMLSPFETSWEELESRGYKGGGVVVILVNENNEVMMYKVPEGKDKPFIGRYAGQLNLFVETADPQDAGDRRVASLEPFDNNLQRAFAEELGIELPNETGLYREIDYSSQVRARCAVFHVPSETVNQVNAHIQTRNQNMQVPEMGQAEWIRFSALDAHWLEPNAKAILDKCLADRIFDR